MILQLKGILNEFLRRLHKILINMHSVVVMQYLLVKLTVSV